MLDFDRNMKHRKIISCDHARRKAHKQRIEIDLGTRQIKLNYNCI
jgi:hypothetical protein